MATIVDQNGQPITKEIATIERDTHRVFFGKRLRNEDDTLLTRGGTKGLKIYEELKRDAHAGAVLAKRKLAVTSRPWKIEPASDASQDKAASDLVQAAFEHLRFNRLCKRLLEATLKGYSVAEVMWQVRDGKWLPERVIARDPRRFVFTVDGEIRLLTRENPIDGEELPPRKFIVHRYGGDDDTPYGLGLGNMLFWPVMFKRQGITFWLTFADKFGSPTALGRYPTSADAREQAKLLAVLQAISQDAGVIIPEGMAIELIEASRAGSVDTYEKLVRYMDEQISKAVLGETMSTTAASAGLGSSQADVHNDVRLELAADDADELNETINDTLVRWIVEFNLGAGVGMPRLDRDFSEPEDLNARATRDKTLGELGFEPSDDYILETYGEGWTRKAPAPPPLGLPGAFPGGLQPGGDSSQDEQPAGSTAGNRTEDPTDDEAAFAEGQNLAAVASQRALHRDAQEQVAQAAVALAGEWKSLVGDQVGQITAALEETGDLVAFRERLTALANQPPSKGTVEAIARATFAGHLIGRTAAATKPPKKPGLAGALSKLLGQQR